MSETFFVQIVKKGGRGNKIFPVKEIILFSSIVKRKDVFLFKKSIDKYSKIFIRNRKFLTFFGQFPYFYVKKC
ncbi:hypothetical protein CO024_01205 [Candidatus Gracilibacteria bacterium CG_4_9_14_0_2_um_filter_38_7]|nr:MAG: hypothetical protein CO024_01205 [Candidatus Gracilibacteria bacterium CG_4_9_14_0_2_um_filter_38_7]